MKLLLLGLSGSGKSTVGIQLARKYKLELIEADDFVMEANGGTWPSGNDEFIEKHFELANEKVLTMQNVLYVISWLTEDRIREFYEKGFKIIEMHADFDVLVSRKTKRDGWGEVKEERFKNTFKGYFETVLSNELRDLYLLSLDTTYMNTGEILEVVTSALPKN